MYFSNFQDENQVYYSKYLKTPSVYRQLVNFYEFYNFHSNAITFNEKTYKNFKFNFLQKITFISLFKTLEKINIKDQEEFYKEMKKKYPQIFIEEELTFDTFKYTPVTWMQFNSFLEKNSFDENSVNEFLPRLSLTIKDEKFDYMQYKKLMKETKREVIVSCLRSIFSRKKDMNYKVLKTENVYSKNILNI